MKHLKGSSMMKKKIVYMGTPHYARAILEALIDAEDMEVVLVITQPDRPVGRKKILTPPPVKCVALEHNIPVLQPSRLKEEGIEASIVEAKPDYIVVAAFGQILPKSILDIAPCINLHASLLPQYRGASPVQQSLLNGDAITGVTSMLMEEGLDTGDILEKSYFEIPEDMRLFALMEQLTLDASALTLSTLRNFESLIPIPQDESEATLCKKIRKEDGRVNFQNAVEIYNKYRAFEGWPGIFVENGTKIDALELHQKERRFTPYEILSFEGDSVMVGCAVGALCIGSLQPISKKPMSAKAYCVGRGLKVGHLLF